MNLLDAVRQRAARLGADLAPLEIKLGELFQVHGLQHPKNSLGLFRLLRRWKPTLVAGNFAMVTKCDDIREVLEHGEAFTVDVYRGTMEMLAGLGTLGMGPTPEYDHDSGVMRKAVRPEDAPYIARLASVAAAELIERALPTGQIDAVRGLTNPVPTRLVGEYFGTPGLDPETQLYWVHVLFDEIFLNLLGDEGVARTALAANAAWSHYVDGLIAERKAALRRGKPIRDDVLGRLVRMQPDAATHLSDQKIRANLIYMMVGFIPQVSKAAALALDELLSRPEALAGAQRAARDDDDALLAAYVFEAMRFNPSQPGLMRRCAYDAPYTLARGTTRETEIPAGSVVFAALPSAMFDEDVLDQPELFRLDRPWEHYLFFGAGQHTCLGRYVSRAQLPLILKPLLRQPNLRRLGSLAWDEGFPASLMVGFDPPPPRPARRPTTQPIYPAPRPGSSRHHSGGPVTTVETYRGPVDTSRLGTTLMHEHVFVLSEGVYGAFPALFDRAARIKQAVDALTALYDAGVSTMVDLSVLGHGRDISLLKEIADQSPIQIIAATGIYTHDVVPPFFQALPLSGNPRPHGAAFMADLFVRDIEEGIGGSGVRAAILKCASDAPVPVEKGPPVSITPDEHEVMLAVAQAHRRTGVPINTHSDSTRKQGTDQLDIFESAGVDLSRVIVGHAGDSTDLEYLQKLVARGAYLGMDRFGLEFGDYPKAAERCQTIAALCQAGHADHLILSHDASVYIDWYPEDLLHQLLPNWNYLYLGQKIIPALKTLGVTDAQIDTMLVQNPRAIFSRQGGY